MDLGSGGAITAPIIRLHNASLISVVFSDKDVNIRAVVGTTCVLSIIGSVLLIVSYFAQKNHTKAREILAHISLMDLGVSLSNLIGLSVYFDQYYAIGGVLNDSPPPLYIRSFCKIQAFFAVYCTLGSTYWTTALAAYLYIVILHHKNPNFSLYFLRFCYILCYGLSIGISIWLLASGRMGYSPYGASGWCAVDVKNPVTKETDIFLSVFAYDLWIYLAIVLIILFYVAIRIYLSNQVSFSVALTMIMPHLPQKVRESGLVL
jgi:G protein-coupled receptor 157